MPLSEILLLTYLAMGLSALRVEQTPYVVSETPDPHFLSFDQAMIAFMEKRKIPGGALAVVKEGRLVYAQGYGYADRERKERVRATSLFRIASISKPFTAIALMKLVQEGRGGLTLETKAFPYLSLSPVLERGKQPDPRLNEITLRQLLQHTAGFDRDKSGDPMFEPIHIAKVVGAPAPATPETIIRYMLGKPLDFDPGTRYAYSNFGYCVLGRVIEKATGKPYETYVREEILAPLKIRRMRIGKSLLSGRANGEVKYYQENLGVTRSVFTPSEEVAWAYGGFYLEAMDAHGGWIGSAVDLARFAAALDTSTTALNAEITKALYALPPPPVWRTPQGEANDYYYGLGWLVRPLGRNGKANYWHNGSLPGTYTLLVRRSDGLSWVALFNQRSEGGMPSDREIDPALHLAANAVKQWGNHDLFPKFLR
jgi:N-acyl-D-amino-acid deacylase